MAEVGSMQNKMTKQNSAFTIKLSKDPFIKNPIFEIILQADLEGQFQWYSQKKSAKFGQNGLYA